MIMLCKITRMYLKKLYGRLLTFKAVANLLRGEWNEAENGTLNICMFNWEFLKAFGGSFKKLQKFNEIKF